MTVRRGVPLVFGLIGLAVLVSAVGIAVLYTAAARGGRVPGAATLVLRPGGDLRERAPDDVFGQFAGAGDTVRQFVDGLRRAKADDRITAVLLAPYALDSPYWAKLQELRDAVLDFRESGKPVIAFLEYGGDREYYLASAADQIYLLRSSPLDLAGVASYEVFLRGALDKVGVQPDFLHVGDYKTAPNQLTESSMPAPHREMAESLNRDTFDQVVTGLAEARGRQPGEMRALVDRGPFTPEAALQAGLVDGLAYADELDERVPALRGLEDRGVTLGEYDRGVRVGLRPRTGHRIALLYAVGTIVSGESGSSPAGGPVIGSDDFVEEIRRIRDDDSIAAVVVRIDSPGGSSVASDVIWRELMLLRQDDPSRPLVASMSDLAASGGYYIAMPAEIIVAQPGTLTGSIGIYAGKMAVGGTLAKAGVGYETIKSGADADIYSPFTPFTPGQRRKLQGVLDAFYDGFVQKASESRRKTADEIDRVARGRVWTGRQAQERGLVDALGGLDTAIAIARERAGIPAGDPVTLVVYPARRSLYEALVDQMGGGPGGLGAWAALVGGSEARAVASLVAPGRLFRRGEPLALMPFTFIR